MLYAGDHRIYAAMVVAQPVSSWHAVTSTRREAAAALQRRLVATEERSSGRRQRTRRGVRLGHGARQHRSAGTAPTTV
ncbi:uncharacterized protein M6B38_394670 [Iris pallida]|uniref:Uncharacterized protein n=1 Tax=Iris pallida TaxID=29817 RepID=A0AAX6FY69_IRIPA|nr:Uncharacterized protein M6B38_224110 [Iris pallida]KAJ6820988.1 uncharacterized protein M6B38_394670 [Iris pallida]